MSETTDKNKKIAKNTLLLYIRMLFMMAISLYTSRIILKVLGVEDYGVYNVVGGVVTTLVFLQTTLSSASQRFITFELGKETSQSLKKVFSNCLAVHIGMGIIIVVLLETVGIWFLNTHLNIPQDRLFAANIAFQCSLGSFFMTMLSVPYNALIIAHEKMGAFAYISIVEVLLKLISVFSLIIIPYDKMILYAILLFVVAVIIRIIYSSYCIRHFEESKVKPSIDKELFKSILSFSGYNLIEVFANMLADQGLNIMLNMFFGPVVNAARGIALQVNNAIAGFINNFTAAVNPQITKSYAINDINRVIKLVAMSNKYSFFLFLLLSLPIYYKIDYILQLWLETPPEYCAVFIKLLIIARLWSILTTSFYIAISATGNIKTFQLIMGIIRLLILPCSYIFIKDLYHTPIVVFYILIVFEIIGTIVKPVLLKRQINIYIKEYIRQVIIPCLIIGFVTFSVTYYIKDFFATNFYNLVLFALADVVIILIFIITLGLSKSEREFLKSSVNNKLKVIMSRL